MTKNFFVRTATAGIAALVLCGSAVADTWRVATEGTFPPFEFYNSTTGENAVICRPYPLRIKCVD